MRIEKFFKESGFKVLAMAHLSQSEYSIVLYLLNCAISGLDQFVTTKGELASILGLEDERIEEALTTLSDRRIIKIRYTSKAAKDPSPTFRIGLEYQMNKWHLKFAKDVDEKDAIVYPFRRRGDKNLQLCKGAKKEVKLDKSVGEKKNDKNSIPTWQRVSQSFLHGRSLDEQEIADIEETARVLVETYPVDQIILMIRHFGTRIPSLSLLASSWQHYHEQFEEETQKVDLIGARKKHLELDIKIREEAAKYLKQREQLELSEEERAVLKILSKHRHPRRQLFWAYQLRSRYPKLSDFFSENSQIMLPITSGGTVVKKTPKNKK